MNFSRLRPRRQLAGVLAGALAFSASPLLGVQAAGAADALPPLADPIGAGNFCEHSPTTEPFTDVSASDPSFDEIICLVNTSPQLTKGTTATTYSPNLSITRRQMALFIKRTADLANTLEITALTALPAGDGATPFTDIAGESAETKKAIDQLHEAGIVLGTTTTTYSPAPVSRRQMAAFVNRLQKFLTGTAFSTTGNYFNDDNGDSGEANLNAVASVGIFQGDGAGNVDPGGNLSRRQMANVLLRHLQVLFDDGDITGAFSGQAFSVTPAAAVTQTWVDNPEAPSNTSDDRQYTASGLTAGSTYKIALFPAANVKVTSGKVTFVDADASANQADGVGTPAADILIVNGAANSAAVASAQPLNGSITFTVDGDNAEESVIPVLWLDNGAHANQLDLVVPAAANTNPKEPSEAFGIGGSVSYVPAEAASGAHTSADVVTPNIASNYFTSKTDVEHAASTETFSYDANDVFQYQAGGITLAQFESMISAGDTLTVGYDSDPAGVSTFNITTDAAPTAPAITSVTVTNLDGGTTSNDVQVRFTPPAANAAGVVYKLQRGAAGLGTNTACGGGDDTVAPSFADVSATVVTNADGTRTFTNSNVADGCYDYRIVATNPISGSSASGTSWVTTLPSGQKNGVKVPGGDTVSPTSTFLTQSNGTGVAGTLDGGDTIDVVFSEAMAVPGSGDTIRFTDADGTIADVTCGAAAPFANCSRNSLPVLVGTAIRPPNTVLTLVLRADPTPISPGTVSDLAVATGAVTAESGNTDVAGNAWNLAGSTDKTLA